jgi:hypothetical protein
LEQFDRDEPRFILKDTFEDFGIGQVDETIFVFSSGETDPLMEATNGDLGALEKALDYLTVISKDNVIRVDICDPGNCNSRIPSGDEVVANSKWAPRGYCLKGMLQAVIDGSKIPLEDLGSR